MDAVISGQAGVALLVEGKSLASMLVGRPGESVPRREHEVCLLFGEARDLEFLEAVDLPEVEKRLEIATARVDALHLALILLDADLSDDTREEAARELDELLPEPEVGDFVERILFGHPLPGTADLAGAIAQADRLAPQAAELFHRLEELQASVVEVHLAWEAIPEGLVGSSESRLLARRLLVQAGVFRDLVLARAAGRSMEDFLVDALLNPALQDLPNRRSVLMQWASPFRLDRKPSSLPRALEISPEEDLDDAVTRERELSLKEIRQEVDRRKELVLAAMDRGDDDLMRREVESLIDFHLRHGGEEFACKSLCDLASQARETGRHRKELELTSYAVRLRPEDSWAWAQHGHALLRNARSEEALAAYDQSISLGERAAALTGRAEVLRSQNRLDEALAAYDAAISKFPNDVVARAGRAEVLRSQNRLDEALAAYDAVIADFPENAVARNGRAEVLRSQNRLDEALAAYDAVIAKFPNDVVARTGRAEVLKAQNRLSEALAAYDSVIADFPGSVFARSGRAEVLRAQNRLSEALSAYEEIRRGFPEDLVARNGYATVLVELGRWDDALALLPVEEPSIRQDWIAYHIRGMALVRKGRIDEAAKIFEAGTKRAPAIDQDYFRTALAFCHLRRWEYPKAAELLGTVKDRRLEQPANVLLFHALGASGKQRPAEEAYHRIGSDVALPVVKEVVAELKQRYLERKPPQHSDEWLFQNESRILLAA